LFFPCGFEEIQAVRMLCLLSHRLTAHAMCVVTWSSTVSIPVIQWCSVLPTYLPGVTNVMPMSIIL